MEGKFAEKWWKDLKTNRKLTVPENGWLEDDSFPIGASKIGLFSGDMSVSGRVDS